MTGFPLTNYDLIRNFIRSNTDDVSMSKSGMLREGPVIFHGKFELKATKIYDTYLDVSGWGKVTKRIIQIEFVEISGAIKCQMKSTAFQRKNLACVIF